MDALQQSHRFMRPAPPMTDPYHHLPQPPRGPPPQAPWYSSQFQYQASHPPPPHQQPGQWSLHSDHQHIPPPSAYHTPHTNPIPPYPAQPHHPQYSTHPPSHVSNTPPHLHHHHHPQPPPPPPSQAYPQSNQAWGNPNWAHHQGWEYPDRNILHNNEEDWAARARAWAASKAATENQHPQSLFTPVGRHEEHNQIYHEHYQQAVDLNYVDSQQASLPVSSYQQYPVSTTNPPRAPANHPQDSSSFCSEPYSASVLDEQSFYRAREGASAAELNYVYPHQGSVAMSSSIYQQEVPSSYSSFQGKEEPEKQREQFYKPPPLPISSPLEGHHHVQSTVPVIGRSISVEQSHFTHGDRFAEPKTDLSDLPLEFAPGFTRDIHMQASFSHPDISGPIQGLDPTGAVQSVHAWTSPSAPGVAYPSVTPIPSGPQFDPSFAAPSVTEHTASVIGRIPGPTFRPAISSVSSPFALSAGSVLHPTTVFPGDANGAFNVSERPKKASVPNWLREEIIKKKATMTSSVPVHLEQDPFQPIDDEGVDKSFRRGDQAETKSNDSSRSNDDEDDDEDVVEAARTAAINQEIKRVLTEVLLKVTDELFDEIATKVLSEDDLAVEVDNNTEIPRNKVLPSPPTVPTPKASAKVLVPFKAKESDDEDVSGKSGSSSPGDVLGLGSYASDDDDDEEIQNSNISNTKQVDVNHQKPNIEKLIEDEPETFDDGSLEVQSENLTRVQPNTNIDYDRINSSAVLHNHGAVNNGHSDNVLDKDLGHENTGNTPYSGVQLDKNNIDGGKTRKSPNAFEVKKSIEGKACKEPELPSGSDNTKKLIINDSQIGEAKIKSDKNDGHDSKRSLATKDSMKVSESGKIREDGRHSNSDDYRRRDERHSRREKADEKNGLKEKVKEQGVKPGYKVKESDLRKKSSRVNARDDKRENDRVKSAGAKEDGSVKRERLRDDRPRHNVERDSNKHKRQRSSSDNSKDRNSRDNSLGSHASDSSDKASEDSRKRKLHSKRRSLSPSPVRLPRRQVSRSPHSKHSQRRHSPHSSIETTRGKRSRSKSPVRWRK